MRPLTMYVMGHNTRSLDVFPTRLTNAMNSKGYTVKDLAKILHCRTNVIYTWLNGSNTPSRESIYWLSIALDVSEGWLSSGRK